MLLSPQCTIKNGRYKILKQLGGGAFGQTYLVESSIDGIKHQYALKQLNIFPGKNQEYQLEAQKRFDMEADVLRDLGTHDRIPYLIDYFQETGQFFLVEEFIDGETLDHEIRRKQQLTQAEVIRLLIDVLEILQFVHNHKKIHRDIKPANLIRRQKDQRFVLIDFGAVKAEITTINSPQTIAIGTPGYMPLEQVAGKPVYASDIYALGMVGIHALTGCQVSKLNVEEETIQELTQLNPKCNWHRYRTNISPDLAEILTKMIHRKIQHRYSSAKEVLNDLKPIQSFGIILKDRYEIIKDLSYFKEEDLIRTYLVKDKQLSTEPIKLIKAFQPRDNNPLILEEARNCFNQEIELLKSLNFSQPIPELFDSFEENDIFYVVYEFIVGKNLEAEIRENHGNCWSESEAIDFLKSVLPILEFIHKQGIIHLDIKPSNLIRNGNGKIFLTDFGRLKEIVNLRLKNGTQLKHPVGTKGYMSPEQENGNPKFNSDLYALGMITIQGLIGESPENFERDSTTGEIILSKINLSRKLTNILDKMICNSFRERYQTATEILKDLGNKKTGKITVNSIITPKFKINKIWWIITALGTLIITGFILFEVFKHQEKHQQASFQFSKGDELLEQSQNLEKTPEVRKMLAEMAKESYENGLSIDPYYEAAWLKKAKAFNNLQDFQGMLDTCLEGINYFKNSKHLWNCKGLALQKMGNATDAIQSYIKVTEIDPNHFEALHNLGILWMELGQKNQAIKNFKRAIKVGGEKSFVSWNDLGRLYYQYGDFNLALDAYDNAIAINPNYLPAWIGKGNTHKQFNENQKAIDAYSQAIKINPNSYEAWHGKGGIYFSEKMFNRAKEAFEKALSIKPDYQAAKDGIKMLENSN